MIGRTSMKARLGIATAVLVGGGAIGVAVVAANGHNTATTAQSAGFTTNFSHTMSEQQALSSALSTWGTSQQKSLSTLAQMAPMRTFSQTTHHNTTLAVQRGVVVLATKKFLLVKSSNGALHLWWLKGDTKFDNASSTATGMSALTGSNTATQQAMVHNNMSSAATVMAGSTTAVSQLTAPAAKPTTITVQTGTTTVTVTISASTATVAQATPTKTGMATTKSNQWAFDATKDVARGDLVLVAGARSHGSLDAQLVLFAAPTTTTPTASASATPTTSVSPTSTPTVSTTPTTTVPASNGTATFSGTHS
jgi:hypothetical protein